MKECVWLSVSDKCVQEWLEYDSNNISFVIKYNGNLYLNDNLPIGIGTLIKDNTAKILILPNGF